MVTVINFNSLYICAHEKYTDNSMSFNLDKFERKSGFEIILTSTVLKINESNYSPLKVLPLMVKITSLPDAVTGSEL